MDTLGDLIRRRAATHGERPAITIAGTTLTYADVLTNADAFSRALHAVGLKKGDHAAVMLPNGPAFIQAWTGMATAGVVEVPLHTALRADGLRHALILTNAKLVVVSPDLEDRIATVAPGLPHLRTIIVAGPKAASGLRGRGENDAPRANTTDVDVITLADFIARAAHTSPMPEPPTAVGETDPSAVLFTSGTTGPSKGVVLSHRANFRLARTTSAAAGLTEDDVLLTTFPLFHIAARYVSTLGAMLLGAHVVIEERFSASAFWTNCAEQGVTAVHYLGSLLTILLAQPEDRSDQSHPVRLGYGAGAPGTVAEAFRQRFGLPLRELYGMTETGAVTMNRDGATRLGSCGQPLDDCQVAIVDDDDVSLPANTTGEIVVRPNRPHIMIESYIGMPEATLAAFRNLWFHTGDTGWLDDDGYLWFVGRKKDAIRRRGENVSAFEVEVVLDAHPDVIGSAVVGFPDEISGEEVAAFLQLQPHTNLDPRAIFDHCAARLPYFAVPRYLITLDVLPRNTSQRVQKHLLPSPGVPDHAVDRQAIGYHLAR